MKRQSKIAALLLLTLIGSAISSSPAEEEYDLIIKGGRIIDGTGNPWFRADLGVKKGRIAKIGNLERAGAKKVINATGLVVAPGFIDMHNHSELGLSDPELRFAKMFLTQGITTVMLGVDGLGSWDFKRLAETWERQGIGINAGFYVGHNAIRTEVLGVVDRAPTPEEMGKMKALVRTGMENGAFGLSTGLVYIPSIYSKTEEIIELAKVAAQYGGIYDTHHRDEFHGFLGSLAEAIEICEKARIPLHIAHIKILGRHNWGKMADGIALIEKARARGLEVTADQYPWTNGAMRTSLAPILQIPPGMGRLEEMYLKLKGFPVDFSSREEKEQYTKELIMALRDPAACARIKRATEEGLAGAASRNWIKKWGYDWLRVEHSRARPEYVGQTLVDIASWKGIDAFSVMVDLIMTEDDNLVVSIGPLSEDDLVLALKQPWVMFSSDGSLVPFGQGFVHPRSYGSFPRVLGRYVREKKILGLEEAVRKMTSLPAQTLRLRDRGLLREGFWADIVLFDPKAVREKATYTNGHRYSEGINHVLVNGLLALENGEITREAAGKVLYRH